MFLGVCLLLSYAPSTSSSTLLCVLGVRALQTSPLEYIMLCELSPTQKDKYCMIHLYEVPGIVKFIETESTMVIVRG